LTAGSSYSSDFANSDTFACPYTVTVVNKDDDNVVATSIHNPALGVTNTAQLMYYDSSNRVKINESLYDGTNPLEFRIKVITGFGEALYKPVTINNRCPTQVTVV
jgi:hypothetical protein